MISFPMNPPTVLIIEDDDLYAAMLIEICKKQGDCNVVRAKTLRDAHELLSTCTPDVVLSDNVLADGFGPLIFPLIRKNNPKVKICLISGDVREPNNHGADLYLQKPVKAEPVKDFLKPFF